jgi:hypothetical protein
VAGDIQFPNGMVIAPDGRTLIISESFAGRLTAFDIDADGGLSGRRLFAEGLGPDGICTDAAFMRRVAQERLGTIPDEVPGCHCAALSHPRELTGLLVSYLD